MKGPGAHHGLPVEQGAVKKASSPCCHSSCVSPEGLSIKGQRGGFEYACMGPRRLVWNCHAGKVTPCRTPQWAVMVGWELEGIHQQDSAPGSHATVSSSHFCKGPV